MNKSTKWLCCAVAIILHVVAVGVVLSWKKPPPPDSPHFVAAEGLLGGECFLDPLLNAVRIGMTTDEVLQVGQQMLSQTPERVGSDPLRWKYVGDYVSDHKTENYVYYIEFRDGKVIARGRDIEVLPFSVPAAATVAVPVQVDR